MPLPEDIRPDTSIPAATPPSKDKVLDAIRELLHSEEFVDHLVKSKRIKRPPQTSKHSTYSYFREIFALQIKASLDHMIETKHDMEWKFSMYPEMKPSSLYQRVYQSCRYLITYLDPDEKYGKARQMMALSREKTGIRLSWIRDRLEGRDFVGVGVDDLHRVHEWKEAVELFLADSSKKILHLKRLSLSTQQIETLQQSFEGLEGVHSVITEREIKIVKDDSMVIPEETGQGYES